ncbi:Uncharacterised protein [Burkholderia pseudomallei]|nr:Uncharacterised protein [Burkholderia pseudomallei]
MEHKAPARRGGIDALGQRAKADTALFQLGHGLHQVGQRAAQAVELPDGQRIAFAQIGQGGGQAWPVGFRAARHVLEHLRRAGGVQRLMLHGRVLIGRRYAGVADHMASEVARAVVCWIMHHQGSV